ncbi:pectinesterase inhibitor-like protein [Trifolium pratense]|uniref:Pectinesterase inhibitor-like protein n=1 Tax=Trifolium pratense TaxID=57577 RepID=A0A2K3JLK7_TRIPR|nr:pectinesterase inhibitor-like protein [Trifolium pratense]
MTMLKPLAFLILIVCTTFVVTQCRTIQPNDANLIQQTCKKTPNYALCIQYLNSDPKAPSADVTGLALIMVNVMKNKANIAINKIHQLIGKSPPDQKATLNSCASKYNAIVVADIPSAIEALQKGNPKFAEQGANDAANEANSCENGFSGKSPLTAENNAMHDVSVITSAIVRLLL